MHMKKAPLTFILAFLATSVAMPTQGAAESTDLRAKILAKKGIFFAADGMRPDLMEKYAGRRGHADLC